MPINGTKRLICAEIELFMNFFFVTLHAMRVGLTNCVCRFKAVIKRVE